MYKPLAARIRPQTIDEMVGQQHLIGKNAPLRRIIESGAIPNMIFYGSSGIGKTTLAGIIAAKTNRPLYKLNATTASTGDIKDVINELNVPVLAMGLHDVVISASPEGILVSDKEQSSYIKPFVDRLDQQVMFAEKSWGSFRVMDVEEESLTIKVTLKAGHRMNYHSHRNRDEVWVVTSGAGRTIVDGMEQEVKAGDVITMQAGCRHTIIAESELKLVEVQLGREISVHDKQKYELEYE